MVGMLQLWLECCNCGWDIATVVGTLQLWLGHCNCGWDIATVVGTLQLWLGKKCVNANFISISDISVV